MSPTPNRIALVAARWHSDIVDRAVSACRAGLAERGFTDIDVIEVPGAFEIPLRIKRLASTGRYAALAGCALVVDGGIYRHDFVAATVVDALMRVQLDTDVPVFSAVLTPHHFHEHSEHLTYFSRHFEVKGAELANAIAATLNLDTIPA
ncbi:6,7-dimethyl-8-ribityllumazine synthase [Nocardia sp. NPDC049707]|uniref:6,7-dimethyl-8-ribityllumazine synthase n=1 Tax=Nocardia sp. NPDC049707 TaxID=3154735 RepID=UPI003445C6E4